MLRHARGRLAIAKADAQRLPLRDESLPAVISVMVHTDMPGYLAVVRRAARVLRPGGALVHVGVPPVLLRRVRRPERPAGLSSGPATSTATD